MKNRAGFTLIELVISLSLSSLVLIGLVAMATAIVRQHMDGIKRGEVNSTTLYALSQMNRELETATLIEEPVSGGSSDVIRGCVNWTRSMSPPDGQQMASDCNATDRPCGYWFSYCAFSDASGSHLYRYSNAPGGGCPAAGTIPAPCDTTGTPIVFGSFFTFGAPSRFSRNIDGTLRLQYQIGSNVSTEKTPQPIFYEVDTLVTPTKAMGFTTN